VQTRTGILSGGRWSVEAGPALAQDTYTARASGRDDSGNPTASAPHTFAIDTTPPHSSATSASAAASGAISVAYQAADAGPAGLSRLELFAKGPGDSAFRVVATNTSPAPTGALAYAAQHGAGAYDFYTVATDRAQNREAPPGSPDATATIAAPPTVVTPEPTPSSAPPFAAGLRPDAKQSIRSIRRRGLATSLTCSAPCVATITLRLPAQIARRLGLTQAAKPVTIGRVRAQVSGPGTRRKVRVKLQRRMGDAIAPLRTVTLRIEAKFTPAAGGPTQLRLRTVVLRR
jgi:hypothetical protein